MLEKQLVTGVVHILRDNTLGHFGTPLPVIELHRAFNSSPPLDDEIASVFLTANGYRAPQTISDFRPNFWHLYKYI